MAGYPKLPVLTLDGREIHRLLSSGDGETEIVRMIFPQPDSVEINVQHGRREFFWNRGGFRLSNVIHPLPWHFELCRWHRIAVPGVGEAGLHRKLVRVFDVDVASSNNLPANLKSDYDARYPSFAHRADVLVFRYSLELQVEKIPS